MAVLVKSGRCRKYRLDVERLRSCCAHPRAAIQGSNVSTSGEIDAAFDTFAHERPDAIFVSSDPFFTSRRVQVANLAARHNLPLTSATREISEAGGLMSYGTNIADAWRQVGIYTGRILHGAKPTDLPVMQVSGSSWSSTRRLPDALGLAVRRRCSPAPTR